MSTTTITMSSTPLTMNRQDKRQSKIIILRLSSSALRQFSKRSPIIEEMPRLKSVASHDINSEAPSTPLPVDAPSPGSTTDKKPPSVNGVKRSTPAPDGSKPKARPGPKKKPRLEDGTIDHSSSKPTTNNPNQTANPRLGPKANTGFINANLRALDRTGTPCRKWQRRGFNVKSFTGVLWEVPSWKGSATSALNSGTSDSSTKDVSMSSDQKQSETDTAGSNSGDLDKMDTSTYPASSPPVMMAKINGYH